MCHSICLKMMYITLTGALWESLLEEWVSSGLLQGPGTKYRRAGMEPSEGSPIIFIQFTSVQSFSHVRLFVTPRTTAFQASLSITNSQSSLKLMSMESVMPSNHLILCHPTSFALNLSQHQGLFPWVSALHQVAKVLKLQHQTIQRIFRVNFL